RPQQQRLRRRHVLVPGRRGRPPAVALRRRVAACGAGVAFVDDDVAARQQRLASGCRGPALDRYFTGAAGTVDQRTADRDRDVAPPDEHAAGVLELVEWFPDEPARLVSRSGKGLRERR